MTTMQVFFGGGSKGNGVRGGSAGTAKAIGKALSADGSNSSFGKNNIGYGGQSNGNHTGHSGSSSSSSSNGRRGGWDR